RWPVPRRRLAHRHPRRPRRRHTGGAGAVRVWGGGWGEGGGVREVGAVVLTLEGRKDGRTEGRKVARASIIPPAVPSSGGLSATPLRARHSPAPHGHRGRHQDL